MTIAKYRCKSLQFLCRRTNLSHFFANRTLGNGNSKNLQQSYIGPNIMVNGPKISSSENE